MTASRTIGCAFGPCLKSKQRDGPGCKLCDVIALLPQRKYTESPRKRLKTGKTDVRKSLIT